MSYFVLKESEILPGDLKPGDLFRTAARPGQIWMVAPDGEYAFPVSLVRTISHTDLRLGKSPEQISLKGMIDDKSTESD